MNNMHYTRYFLFLLTLILFSCDEKETMEYYPSGQVSKLQKNMRNDTICEENYFENGNLRSTVCSINFKPCGEWVEYYETGEIYHKVNYLNGIKNGEGIFYYKNGSIKAINLFQNDSLYYIKSYSKDSGGFVDKLIPIITQIERESREGIEFSIDIPISDLIPYSKDKIVVHYRIEKNNPETISPLPTEKFLAGTNPKIIKFSANEPGKYKLIGLITFNDEILTKDNDHFFKREFVIK